MGVDLCVRISLYGPHGSSEARGVCQFLSLGLIFPSAKEIDVYNPSGSRIGLIAGQLLTTTAARYNFYDEQDRLVACAYLDWGYSGITVMTPEERTIARLKRHFVRDDIDSWDVVFYLPELLDPRLLKMFAAFAIDFQSYFKKDL